jgi:hypothetical protein
MSDAVYNLEDLRLKVLASLRTRGPSTVETLAALLDLPDWAVSQALASAEVAGLAEPTRAGWAIKQTVAA